MVGPVMQVISAKVSVLSPIVNCSIGLKQPLKLYRKGGVPAWFCYIDLLVR